MVDLKSQYHDIKTEIDNSIHEVIESAQFIQGPNVTEFESNFSSYLEAKYCIGCANGTDAIQLALMSLELNPGDEVITTPFTFVSTAETIALLGLKPVFVDLDARTFNIDVDQMQHAITDRTKVILPVHLFGQSARMDTIMQLAQTHNLYVIEDCAQSVGSKSTVDGKWKFTSTIGHIGTFSFFPSKNLGAYGDGGAIVTQDKNLADKIRCLAKHGSQVKYQYDLIGTNSRLDTLQAAILNVKLQHLDQYTWARQKAAEVYDDSLSGLPHCITPLRDEKSTHVFHQYTLRIQNGLRSTLQETLKDSGIPSMIYYPKPLHLHPAYAYLGYTHRDFPNA